MKLIYKESICTRVLLIRCLYLPVLYDWRDGGLYNRKKTQDIVIVYDNEPKSSMINKKLSKKIDECQFAYRIFKI